MESSPTQERVNRDSTLLRKRTISSSTSNGNSATLNASNANGNGSAVGGMIKPGSSILDQIGGPDHAGWMRKRGERYNSWKLRYFILKGPHLYYLKSNSKTVSEFLYYD